MDLSLVSVRALPLTLGSIKGQKLWTRSLKKSRWEEERREASCIAQATLDCHSKQATQWKTDSCAAQILWETCSICNTHSEVQAHVQLVLKTLLRNVVSPLSRHELFLQASPLHCWSNAVPRCWRNSVHILAPSIVATSHTLARLFH